MQFHFRTFFILLSTLSVRVAFGQTAPTLQGYQIIKDSVEFIFDEKVYNLKPQQVTVTGSFRGWSQDMNDAYWQLKKGSGSVWTLKLENFQLRRIPAAAQFKFRTDGGRWLDPPQGAPTEAGNLVFMKGTQPPTLKAEMHRSRTIWAWVSGHGITRPFEKSKYKLTSADGKEIPIAAVLANDSSKTLITPATELDIRRVYYLEIPSLSLKTLISFDGWMRDLYSEKELGANVSADGKQTSFRVFSPRALKVILYLYNYQNDTIPYEMKDMVKDKDGVWELTFPGDLHGQWYDFTVHGHNDPGNFFFETNPVHVSDPYARVTDDTFGKCRVWRKTKPATPLAKGIPKLQDLISYEVHVQDFTAQLPVADNLKETLPAMVVPGLKNSKGRKIGFDHLLDLGINAVHFMPVQEFVHYPTKPWAEKFRNDEWMKTQGVNLEDYNWGYCTSHSFAIETRFRDKKSEPGTQREQFRDVVQAFHNKGIAVLVDFVFNHTAANMGMVNFLHPFNAFDQQYYYRNKDLKLIGEYGNETKSEDRPMTQRWIVDQCKHFIEEFGVDGFRIDLAGQTDEQTLKMLRKELGPDIIIYGEPWIASNDPAYEANPDWDWYKADAPICFFQDDARNAFKGPVSNPENKKTDRGYAGGNTSQRPLVMKALSSTFPEEKSPLSGIKYLDIHDNWALADQFGEKNWDGRFGVDETAFKIAATLLYTASGPIVTHGGTEFMRSKGLAPLEEIVKKSPNGSNMHYHGKRDTYNTRFANQFIWENIGKTRTDKGSFCDYNGMLAYWQGLNKFRNSAWGEAFRQAQKLKPGHYTFFTPANEALLGYLVSDKVLVVMNVEETEGKISGINLPAGKWKLVGNGQSFDLKGVSGPKVKAGSQDLTLKGRGVLVWVKE